MMNGEHADDIRSVQAIDMHAHIGRRDLLDNALIDRFCSGDAATVTARATAANTRLTVVSSLQALFPRGKADAFRGNKEAFPLVCDSDGLLMWTVVNPLQKETYSQAAEMLRSPKCPGIKIHPEEHIYPITEHGHSIFEFAAREEAIVISHSGEKNSMPEDLVAIAVDFPGVVLIVSHLGCGWDGDPGHQVRAIAQSRQRNVYVDTSSAMNIMPSLIEWGVEQLGAERLLYGTDSPLYFAPMQRARIDYAEIGDADKRKILYENAERILEGVLPKQHGSLDVGNAS